jgi:hypothetical protein
MTIHWPETLPLNVDTFIVSTLPSVRYVDGAMRRCATARVAMRMSADQFADLLGWFDSVLDGGALPFDGADPLTGDERTYSMRERPVYQEGSAFMVWTWDVQETPK